MTITLNIDNHHIRLVSQQANRIEVWENLDLPEGLIKDGLVLDPAAVADLLKEHFKTLKLSPQRVSVCLTGLSFIYRVLTLPNLKTINLRAAVERATQKEISLPLENLYVDWQVIKRSDQELEIFVMGIARQMVDVLLSTLRLAGLKVETLELKALALARAAIHKNALVVDCEPEAFEILIVREGVPVTIHRVNPKNELSTFEDNLNQMLTELNRTIDYYNLNHPGTPLTRATPVMLSGSLCDELNTRRLIVGGIGQNIEFFIPSIPVPVDFPISTFASNLGLIYKSKSGSKPKNLNGIDLVRARRITLRPPMPFKKLLMSGIVVGVLLLFVLLWLTRQQATNQSVSLHLKADSLNQELLLANQNLRAANQVQAQIQTLTAESQQIQAEREDLSGKGQLATILKSITDNLPDGAVFTQISSLPGKITIDGSARTREDIVNYIHTLERQGQFSEVRIALMDTSGDQAATSSTFRIIIER